MVNTLAFGPNSKDGDTAVAKKTHLFYLDEGLKRPVELGAEGVGDRLVYANHKYCVIRHDQRLFCTTPAQTTGDTTFAMAEANPVFGAMALAEMHGIGAHIVHGDERIYAEKNGEYEWKLEPRS